MELGKTQFKHMAVGLLVAYAITSIALLGYAMLITYTNLSERNLPMVVAITTVISVMVAGFDAAKGATSRGWLWGMFAGLAYILIMAVIMVLVLPTFSLDMRTLIVCLLGLGGGGIGGMIGINARK